jgi:hypothetical protein
VAADNALAEWDAEQHAFEAEETSIERRLLATEEGVELIGTMTEIDVLRQDLGMPPSPARCNRLELASSLSSPGRRSGSLHGLRDSVGSATGRGGLQWPADLTDGEELLLDLSGSVGTGHWNADEGGDTWDEERTGEQDDAAEPSLPPLRWSRRQRDGEGRTFHSELLASLDLAVGHRGEEADELAEAEDTRGPGGGVLASSQWTAYIAPLSPPPSAGPARATSISGPFEGDAVVATALKAPAAADRRLLNL